MYGESSRQTTGLLLVTSLCIHVLLLCALLMSYHVHNVLITKRLTNIVPPYHSTHKPANIIFYSSNKRGSLQAAGAQAQGSHQNASSSSPTVTPRTKPETVLSSPLERAPTSVPKSYTTTHQPALTQGTHSIREHSSAPSSRSSLQHTYSAGSSSTITMQDIVRGFLASVEQEQKVTESRHLQTTQNMVRENYEMKVLQLFQKAVLVASRPITMTRTISALAEVALTIDRKGNIVNFEFNHSLSKQDLLVVETFLRHAAYSTGLYPSFPRTFAHDRHRISLPLHIQVTQGKHTYVITTNYRPI